MCREDCSYRKKTFFGVICSISRYYISYPIYCFRLSDTVCNFLRNKYKNKI